MSAPLRILLVDDEPSFAQALRVTLEAQGFECTSETDMSSALRYLAENTVAVLVTDIMMPPGADFPKVESSETGFHLVSLVRHRWPKTPIICLSVIGDQQKISSLKRQGVRYLRKGEISLERTVEIIRAVARRSPSQSV